MLIRTATLVGSIKERANAENFLLEPSACTTWSATSGSGQVLGLVPIPGRSKLAGIGFTREEAGVVDSKSGCDPRCATDWILSSLVPTWESAAYFRSRPRNAPMAKVKKGFVLLGWTP